MSNIIYNFKNQNFVVTGASSGMGKQIAIELAEAGANVLAIARGKDALLLLQELYPHRISISAVDVCDGKILEDSITNFVKEKGKLDGAVHAAGITMFTPLRVYDDNVAKTIMDISFWAGTKLLQICTKNKNSKNGSSFVMFSSVMGKKPDKGTFSYAASKAGLCSAARAFAKEVANREVRINTISPGWVITNMTKGLDETNNLEDVNKNHILGLGKPEDVSGVVLFMLSDRSKWMTGTDIVVDGGYLA